MLLRHFTPWLVLWRLWLRPLLWRWLLTLHWLWLLALWFWPLLWLRTLHGLWLLALWFWPLHRLWLLALWFRPLLWLRALLRLLPLHRLGLALWFSSLYGLWPMLILLLWLGPGSGLWCTLIAPWPNNACIASTLGLHLVPECRLMTGSYIGMVLWCTYGPGCSYHV